MSKLAAYVMAIAVCLGTSALLANSRRSINRSAVLELRWSTDGAFRDGLYLGKLDAERGQPLHPPVGRWSTDQDRSMFAAGYRRGFDESLAAAVRARTND